VRIEERLGVLAAGCSVIQVSRTGGLGGWVIDSWTLRPEDVDRLLEVYRELLIPSYEERVKRLLHGRGIDLDVLLADDDRASELVTRADLCELAAAASLLAADGWPVGRLAMPNVPKSSRRRSESGIDVMSTTLAEGDDGLSAGELLFLASVKHTLTSASRLRSELVASVTEELSSAYVATQLRVYEERLRLLEPELNTDRLFLFLDQFPHPDHVRVVAVAVVDPDLKRDLTGQLRNLPQVLERVYSLRIIYLRGLARLHQKAA
jgi:hypothetical protein